MSNPPIGGLCAIKVLSNLATFIQKNTPDKNNFQLIKFTAFIILIS
jgi:hypothetical protein